MEKHRKTINAHGALVAMQWPFTSNWKSARDAVGAGHARRPCRTATDQFPVHCQHPRGDSAGRVILEVGRGEAAAATGHESSKHSHLIAIPIASFTTEHTIDERTGRRSSDRGI